MKETFLDALFFLFTSDREVLVKPKPVILISLLRYTCKYKLIKVGWIKSPRSENIFGFLYVIGDYGVFYGIFIDLFIKSEYAVKIDKRKPYILDFGSHIGLSILYFKMLFPEAKITGVEPDRNTYALLKKNMAANFPDVVVYNKAVAGRSGKVSFYSQQDVQGDWGNSMIQGKANTRETQVDAILGSSLVHSNVDLVKIDIEGAEYEVLQELATRGKLPLVDRLVFEYHQFEDRASNTLDLILAVLRENGFTYYIDYHLGRSARRHSSMALAEMYGRVYSHLVYAVREKSK